VTGHDFNEQRAPVVVATSFAAGDISVKCLGLANLVALFREVCSGRTAPRDIRSEMAWFSEELQDRS
jgi:hypothetical protein